MNRKQINFVDFGLCSTRFLRDFVRLDAQRCLSLNSNLYMHRIFYFNVKSIVEVV